MKVHPCTCNSLRISEQIFYEVAYGVLKFVYIFQFGK
jgi:hypothetical protein